MNRSVPMTYRRPKHRFAKFTFVSTDFSYIVPTSSVSTSSDLTHHTIPDSELINGFVYYINAIGSRNDYDNAQATVDKFMADANHHVIEVCNNSGTAGPIKLDEGRYRFLLLNEIDHKGMNKVMCFEEIENYLLFPDTGIVAVVRLYSFVEKESIQLL
jgi:hypothetical protein